MSTLPQQFQDMVRGLVGLEPRVEGLLESLSGSEPAVAVRFNAAKCPVVPSDVALVPLGAAVPWSPMGHYLPERPRFTFDPAMHQGLYYVQDPSSMFLSRVIGSLPLDGPVVYLDACAAPGGKTTAAIDALPAGSIVVANEWDYRRAEILKENVMKWGYPAAVVSRGDTSRFRKLRDMFDIIAADVPCSGEGMMRKDDEAVAQWTPALVTRCAERQREIIDNLWPALKPGGYMIYSTCTFNREENEAMVSYLVDEYGAEPLPVPVSDIPDAGILPGIGTQHLCYRFMPHRVDGEGLFVALLRKPGDAAPARPAKSKASGQTKLPFRLPDWFPAGLRPSVSGDTLNGIPDRWAAEVTRLQSVLDVILAGVEVGVVKGRDIIPSQGLAMSTALDRSSFPEVEVSREVALDYLRREAVSLPDGTPRGYVLLTHRGTPLGWVKNIGNRSNNLYPAPWRILKKSE